MNISIESKTEIPSKPVSENISDSPTERLCQLLAKKDFCFLPASRTKVLLSQVKTDALVDWSEFQNSWSNLALDNYMADGGAIPDATPRHTESLAFKQMFSSASTSTALPKPDV